MAQRQDRKFVNGLFARRVWADGKNELFGIGIKKDEFIRNIQAIPADSKGFINLTLGSQKTDYDKFSLWLKDEQQNNNSSSYSNNRSTPPPPSTSSNLPPSDDDDLPF